MIYYTEEILKIIEDCFLSIDLEVHLDIGRMSGASSEETIKIAKARVSQELVNKCRPEIDKHLECILLKKSCW